MKILLTAFDPFGGETVNPAQEAVKLVRNEIAGAKIIKCAVPTVFGKALQTVTEVIKKEKPKAVVLVGQAGGRTAITPERVAINLEDALIPDNEGNLPKDLPVIPGGPAAYFATLPVKAMVRAIQNAGLPGAVSNTAGTYVCNHLMYGVLHLADSKMPGTLAGFIHVPFLSEQAVKKKEPTFGMPLDEIVRGLEAALEAVAVEITGK